MAQKEWIKKENARIHKNTIEFIKKEKERRKKFGKKDLQKMSEDYC